MTVEERTADFDLLTTVAPRRWVPAVFGVVPRGANRRRPSDFVRLGIAALVIVVTALGADDVGGLEKAIFDVLADLPSWIRSSAEVLYHVGSVGTVVVLALAFCSRAGSGCCCSWSARAHSAGPRASGLRAWVDAGPARRAAGLTLHGASPEYPVIVLAVATTMLLVAAPYLLRPARRLVVALLTLGALGALVALVGMPDDVFASIALAWGVAAAFHLVGRHPRGDTVAGAGRPGAVGAGRDRLGPRARGGTGLGRDAVRRGGARRRSGRDRGDRPRRERRAPLRQGVAPALVQGFGTDAHLDARAATGASRLLVAARGAHRSARERCRDRGRRRIGCHRAPRAARAARRTAHRRRTGAHHRRGARRRVAEHRAIARHAHRARGTPRRQRAPATGRPHCLRRLRAGVIGCAGRAVPPRRSRVPRDERRARRRGSRARGRRSRARPPGARRPAADARTGRAHVGRAPRRRRHQRAPQAVARAGRGDDRRGGRGAGRAAPDRAHRHPPRGRCDPRRLPPDRRTGGHRLGFDVHQPRVGLDRDRVPAFVDDAVQQRDRDDGIGRDPAALQGRRRRAVREQLHRSRRGHGRDDCARDPVLPEAGPEGRGGCELGRAELAREHGRAGRSSSSRHWSSRAATSPRPTAAAARASRVS